MSSLLMNGETFTSNNVPSHRRVLKSTENISKWKCNKSLKKKLKKYKLRKDGQEDPDIIDVSQTLTTSLIIKSPNNQNFYSQKASNENRPYNYLTKMVKMKKVITVMQSTPTNVQRCSSESKDEILTSKSDTDKKQTDAFKLLMESRNKSIGSNSPGKEKCEEDECEVQDLVLKKELKTKRILSLNRMAQAKGCLKKLEIEEYREENIKKKMKDRVKRFKDMIGDIESKNNKKEKNKPSTEKNMEHSGSPIDTEVIENRDTLNNTTPIFKVFDLFKDVKENPKSNRRKISEEDEAFLNQLSPSIRKKENMLCYFQKVSKDSDTLDDEDDTRSQNLEQLVIKVKLKSKNQRKNRKSKHITNKDINMTQDLQQINQELQYVSCHSVDNSKKRKRNEDNETRKERVSDNSFNKSMLCQNDNRPKRNTKKPMKYTEDFLLTSSDEELHIFTPKKKRKDKIGCENNVKVAMGNTKELVKVKHSKINENILKISQEKGKSIKKKAVSFKNEEHRNVVTKKATKLAPIFVTKPHIDSAAIEAKQKFLQSGVPIQLKKTSFQHSNLLASDEFQTVVHIQNLSYIGCPRINSICNLINTNYVQDIHLKKEKDLFNKLLVAPVLQNYSTPKFQKNVEQVLQEIKKTYPKFPVYRTYHLLRGKSKGEFKDGIYPDLDNSVEILNNLADVNNVHPDKLNWADKYKPATEKQVIGNFESIKELRRWLVSWTENNAKSKRNKDGSDSSDFYQSDTDSRETMKNENNLLIITGKVGTGKTLSVYAVAAELAIKVIEVNASTKRTGKVILQDLQEATQSHKVDRGKNSTDWSQKSQEVSNTGNGVLKTMKKRGRKKKSNLNSVTKAAITRKESTEIVTDGVRTGMSLILIDDADIVFDQDDGFCYAISQLIQSSKRPVILVTSSLTCPHLQKFSFQANTIKMQPFLPRMLGTWLDIMCLVDNSICSPGFGAKTLDLFKGDIRKTINYLQFYVTSHKYLSYTDDPEVFQGEKVLKVNADDENSCMSWVDNEGWGEKNIGSSNSSDVSKYFMTKVSQISRFLGPLNNFVIWWNLPNVLNYPWGCCNHAMETLNKNNEIIVTKELNKIAAVLDNVSITDYLGFRAEEPNVTSKPWQTFEKDSVNDNENFASYDENSDFIKEISWELMITGIAEAQKVLESEHKTEINYPSMSIQRERDRVVSRHKTLTNCLNPSTALDRRALALDYWSAFRSICRTEKSKTDTNNKRNNRFCHYLKSINIVCKNDYFDNLGASLNYKN